MSLEAVQRYTTTTNRAELEIGRMEVVLRNLTSTITTSNTIHCWQGLGFGRGEPATAEFVMTPQHYDRKAST